MNRRQPFLFCLLYSVSCVLTHHSVFIIHHFLLIFPPVVFFAKLRFVALRLSAEPAAAGGLKIAHRGDQFGAFQRAGVAPLDDA